MWISAHPAYSNSSSRSPRILLSSCNSPSASKAHLSFLSLVIKVAVPTVVLAFFSNFIASVSELISQPTLFHVFQVSTFRLFTVLALFSSVHGL
jgi:hypothetical protein